MKRAIMALMVVFSITTTVAQSDYNLRRRSNFETLPINSRNIVFLGTSITDGCEWHELFSNGRIVNRGISGDRSGWLLDRLDCIVEGQPKRLFLMIGTNDLAGGITPKEIVENVGKLIERFQQESPRTRIYIESILPVNGADFKAYPKHYAQAKNIVKTNLMLENLAGDSGKRVSYIDLYSEFIDEAGNLKKELSTDGLHLKGGGYLIWRDAIKRYVR